LSPQKNNSIGASAKRKREDLDDGDEAEDEGDVIAPGRKKRPKKRDEITTQKGQKQGLEAEDDLGSDADERAEDPDAVDELEQDSEFSESDDGAHDDYNAEGYFDGGEDDDLDDGGGADEDTF
jgi:DNA-directed RNA polymerase III subunit RPC7